MPFSCCLRLPAALAQPAILSLLRHLSCDMARCVGWLVPGRVVGWLVPGWSSNVQDMRWHLCESAHDLYMSVRVL